MRGFTKGEAEMQHGNRRARTTAAVALAGVLLAGCGNTVYGPRRIVQADYLDHGGKRSGVPVRYSCHQPATIAGTGAPTLSVADGNGINLTYEFNRLACGSINARRDEPAATAMMDTGFTLIRLRCNDFFAERAGHQTQARFWRKTIAPVSAVIAGIIGMVNFADDERADAIQILGITQAATVAGFEIYEQEFLFDSENVNAVRRLVMRALDAHSATALSGTVTGFNHGVRHLMDNQMICTPANILELVRASIAGGDVRVSDGPPVRARLTSASDQLEALARTRTAQAFGVAALSDDQVGALWWLSQGGHSADELAVIADRLSVPGTSGFVPSAGGSIVMAAAQQPLVSRLIADLAPATVVRFKDTASQLRIAIANRGGSSAVDAARSIRFRSPTDLPGRSLDVSIASAT
jgi:hypothetical protein